MARYRILIWGLVLLVGGGLCAPAAAAFSLKGTIWERAARAESVDPYLLYSVALAESGRGAGGGAVGPWPWALRGPDGPVYAPSASAARDVLTGRDDVNAFDLGWMQVNVGWNGWRARRIEDLLDPEINVRIGARILAEALTSAPDDRVLGIGRYHSWTDERARSYGARVAEIHRRVLDLASGGDGRPQKASASAPVAGAGDRAVVPAAVLVRRTSEPDLGLISDGLPIGRQAAVTRQPTFRPIIFKPVKWPAGVKEILDNTKGRPAPRPGFRIVGTDPLAPPSGGTEDGPPPADGRDRRFLCILPNAAPACAVYTRTMRREQLAAAQRALASRDAAADAPANGSR